MSGKRGKEVFINICSTRSSTTEKTGEEDRRQQQKKKGKQKTHVTSKNVNSLTEMTAYC